MNDIKITVAKNIAELRQKNGMTQLELAERLNYSDKAVSKWERGDSLPDVSVLLEIADIFGVSLDWLAREDHGDSLPEHLLPKPKEEYRRGVITAMSVLLVWLIAVACFVTLSITAPAVSGVWLAFIFAIPVSAIVWLVLNSVWFNRRLNYVIISVLVWSLLLSAHLTALVLGTNLWMLYLLGVPGQLIIIFWSVIVRRPAGAKKIKAAPKTAFEKTVSARTAEQDGADASEPDPDAVESPQ